LSSYFSIGYILSAPAGSKSSVLLYEVEAARTLKNVEVEVHFPSGQAFKLHVWLSRGTKQILPSKNYYAGDGHTVRDKCSDEIQSGEHIYLNYENTDSTNAQSCFVLLKGELE